MVVRLIGSTMKNFSITLNANISAIKSIFLSSVEEVDFFKTFVSISFIPKYKRRFVGKTDGKKLELRVIHYQYRFLTSHILRGEIEEFNSNKTVIHFKYNYSIPYLMAMGLISIFLVLLLYRQIQSGQFVFSIAIIFMALLLILYRIYDSFTKKKELRYFINRVYENYMVSQDNKA